MLRKASVLIVALLFPFGSANALDQIKTVKTTLNGTITKVGPTEVIIKRGGATGAEEKVPVNEIESIRFDDEPPELNVARSAALSGGYDNALETLDKIKLADIKRTEIKQEYEFLSALAKSRLALASGGDAELSEAGNVMRAFVNEQPQSLHAFEAGEILGDLFLAKRAFPQALAEYAKLEAAPWPDYKLKGAVLRGRALRAEGKLPEAIAAYDAALAAAAAAGSTDELVNAQALGATLGKAVCLAESDKADEGIALVNGLIEAAPKENAQIHAEAYVALGNCLRKADRKQDALLAFLHVDVIPEFAVFKESHAEALFNLSQLWLEVNETERAAEARQMLLERYQGSPWAR